MSVYSGAEIVNNGLVLCLDAANTKSYRNYNMVTYSQDFQNAAYIKSLVISATGLLAPDGTLTASTLTDDSDTLFKNFLRSFTVPGDDLTTYNISLYIKKTSGGTSPMTGFNVTLTGGSTPKSYFPRFNTDTGVLGGGDTNSVTSENNNYWRISFTINNNNTGNNLLSISYYPAAGPYNSSDLASTTGSQTVWGFQITRGAVLLPYKTNVNVSTETWYDLTSNACDATFFNGPSFENINNGTLYFDGVTDYVQTTKTWNDIKGANWNGHLTLEGVFKTIQSPPNSAMGYFGFQSASAYFKFMNTTNLFVDAGVTPGPTRIITPCITNFSNYFGTWVHVCGVYDGTIKTYYNGVLQSTTVEHTLADISAVKFVAGDGMGYYSLKGNIGSLKVYNRALSADEIKQNYNAYRGRYGV